MYKIIKKLFWEYFTAIKELFSLLFLFKKYSHL